MANVYNFSSDRIYVYLFLIDKSGSMTDDRENMRAGLRAYKKDFESFPEANSIAISRSTFNGDVFLEDFRPLSEMDTENYYTGGGTAIYHAIRKAVIHLKSYMQEITERLGVKPIGTLLVLSDGHSEGADAPEYWAKEAVESLNYLGVNTVFVAFGRAISSGFGEQLGFLSTVDVKNRDGLVEFMKEVSKSTKEQSKSLKALGSNFFSKATNSSSAGYSSATTQALDDEDWFDEI